MNCDVSYVCQQAGNGRPETVCCPSITDNLPGSRGVSSYYHRSLEQCESNVFSGVFDDIA